MIDDDLPQLPKSEGFDLVSVLDVDIPHPGPGTPRYTFYDYENESWNSGSYVGHWNEPDDVEPEGFIDIW